MIEDIKRPSLFNEKIDNLNKNDYLAVDKLFNRQVLGLGQSFIYGFSLSLCGGMVLNLFRIVKNKYILTFICGGLVSMNFNSNIQTPLNQQYLNNWWLKNKKEDENIQSVPKVFDSQGPYSYIN